jgi:IPT/TIG domain
VRCRTKRTKPASFLRRARVSAATSSVFGLIVMFVPAVNPTATAATSMTRLLFVAATGSDAGNTCALSARPCATIGHALVQSGSKKIIDVRAGEYHEHGLVVTGTVEIDGSGSSSTTINAEHQGQAILVQAGGALTIDGVTIRNGNSPAHAGGIENSGTLALRHDRLIHNVAVDPGGAIVNYATITALVDVSFVGNSSQSYGGALTNFGTVDVVSGDVFKNNFAQDGAGAVNNEGSINTLDSTSFTGDQSGYAGAIDNSGAIGNLSGDLFWNNEVNGYGAALVNVFGTMNNVSDDTFVGNSVSDPLGQGGAIEQDSGDILTLADDTITGNHATIGGGIDNESGSTIQSISGVIVALNTGTQGADCENFQGTLVDTGHNLESDARATCGFSTASHDLVGVDPGLRALGVYGGPTLTDPPLPTSPVINAGPTGDCPATVDARGVPRPQGAACDIGAVELSPPAPISLAPSGGPKIGGTPVEITGRGFTLTTGITFGGTPVRFRLVDDTTIDVTSPPGHGTEAVKITDPDGHDGSLSFTYDR